MSAGRSLRRTSGSSLNLRNHMNDNYVIVHDVSSSVAFEKYLQFARTVFSYSIRLYNKKDYQRAYVDFTKFQRFIHEKLPSHEGYDHERYVHAKRWLMQADESATQFLEEISFQLDIIEDQKQNPDSRSTFLLEMQKHEVHIFIPEWIDVVDSTGEAEASTRPRSSSGRLVRENSSSPSTTPSVPAGYVRQQPNSSAPNGHPVPPGPHGHTDPHIHSSPRAAAPHVHSHTLNVAPTVPISHGSSHMHAPPPQFHHQHSEPRVVTGQHYSEVVQQMHPPRSHSEAYGAAQSGHSRTSSGTHSPAMHLAPPHHHYEATASAGSSGPPSPARNIHKSNGVYNGDGMYQASFAHGSPRAPGHHSQYAQHQHAQHQQPPAPPKYVLPGIFEEDAAIMRYYRAYTSFDIPMPTVNDCSISIGAHSFLFEQHDFHVNYAPFLKVLPPELCMGRSATEVNRCFFIHLGVATQLHPFVLQSFFRFTAASERDEEEDWEQELAKTVTLYSGCVDANVLQYMWPTNFDKYRILLVSGPSVDPLLTCFVPVNRTRPVEDLYEVVIRNERDHYTLLRPVANLNSRIKIIDSLLMEAKQQQKVYQVCDVESQPSRRVEIVMDQI